MFRSDKIGLAASGLTGLSVSLSVSNHFLNLQGQSPLYRVGMVLLLTIMLTPLIYWFMQTVCLPVLRPFVVLHCQDGEKKCNERRVVIGWCAGALSLSLLLLPIVMPNIPLPPQWHTLEIIATGNRSQESAGSQVWLSEIRLGDKRVSFGPLDKLDKIGNWTEKDGMLVSSGETQDKLSYRFKHQPETVLHVLFISQPAGGKVIVQLDGSGQEVDLYKPEADLTLRHLPVSYTHYGWLVLFYGADILTASLLLVIISALLVMTPASRFFIKPITAVVLVAGVSLFKVIRALWFNLPQKLVADVMGYRNLAVEMKHPYDTGMREPLWIWLVKLFYTLSGYREGAIRVMGVLIFLISAYLVYRLGRDVFEDGTLAIAASALFAWNNFLIDIAVLGLRDIMAVLAVLGVSYFVFCKDKYLPKWAVANVGMTRAVFLSLFFILGSGTHLSSLASLSILLVYSFYRNKIGCRWLLLPLGLAALVMGPYLVYSQIRYHDPFYASNVHAVYWRNIEFKDTGCPGCPNAAESSSGAYGGEPTTVLRYIFELHTPEQAVWGVINGVYTLYFSPSEQFFNFIGLSRYEWFLIYLTGLAFVLFRYPGQRLLWLVPLLLTNLSAFLVFASSRIFAANVPFICLVTGAGLVFIARQFFKVIGVIVTWLDGIEYLKSYHPNA